MRKIIFTAAIILILLPGVSSARKKEVIRSQGGVNIAQKGLVIDASYDPRLDALVGGYKIINAAVANQSFDIIGFDPENDKWWIKLAGSGKEIPVVHNLRTQDPKAWAQLPEKVKGMMSYPLVLPIGGQEVIDLFVPTSVDVEKFTELDVYFNSMDMKFEIVVRQ